MKRQAKKQSQQDKAEIVFKSADQKFLIRNMTDHQLNSFLVSRNEYFEYLASNRNSLIQRVYGIYQVEIEGMAPINFMLMDNTLSAMSF